MRLGRAGRAGQTCLSDWTVLLREEREADLVSSCASSSLVLSESAALEAELSAEVSSTRSWWRRG